jgi:hypothetical protein
MQANCLCTSAADAGRGRGEGTSASRPRCRTAGADCTEENLRALPKVTRTPSSMDTTPQTRPRIDVFSGRPQFRPARLRRPPSDALGAMADHPVDRVRLRLRERPRSRQPGRRRRAKLPSTGFECRFQCLPDGYRLAVKCLEGGDATAGLIAGLGARHWPLSAAHSRTGACNWISRHRAVGSHEGAVSQWPLH